MNRRQSLSVVVPGYCNPRPCWERCVKSILANLTEGDELICVDDGSPERPDYLKDVASFDSRVRVIYLPKNVGLPGARNVGMRRATGDFITFVDSDDVVCPGIYAEALQRLEETKSDIAIFGVRSIWISERLTKLRLPEDAHYGELSPVAVKKIANDGILNYAWNKVYRLRFLRDKSLNFDQDGVPCEDIVFVLNCIMQKARWVGVAKEGIWYLQTHGSLLSRYKSTFVKGNTLASDSWKRFKQLLDKNGLLGDMGELTVSKLMIGEWENIWKGGSPYTLRQRYAFAKSHPEIRSVPAFFFFFKMFLFTALRACFYIKPVQRWHIGRTYGAKPYAKGVYL